MKLKQAAGTIGFPTRQAPPASSLQLRTPPAPRLSEALLSRLWAGQRFPESALITAAGVPLRVLQPGRPGRGPGPDFRDAIIAPPSGALLRGDVELHVRASDFVAHGHAGDRRYDGLVLHVVFDAAGQFETRLPCGRAVAIVPLSPWLARRAREISGWLERPSLWREPCHDAIARLGSGAVLALVDDLGEQRLAEREAMLSGMIETFGAGEALYRALLEGLGYGGAGAIFAGVPIALPYAELMTQLDNIRLERDRAILTERLLREAVAAAGDLRPATRPANLPAQRVAGLARLLARHHPLEPRAADLDSRVPALILAWSAPPQIGRSRAIELLTNAVLPWAAARAAGASLQDAPGVRELLAALPRPGSYGALSFLEANLRDGHERLPITARRQQGLLALYKSECTTGGCGRCALS